MHSGLKEMIAFKWQIVTTEQATPQSFIFSHQQIPSEEVHPDVSPSFLMSLILHLSLI